MGDGEVVQLVLGGGGAYFKLWPIGGCLFESGGGGANSRIYGSCELPILFWYTDILRF